jgi:hypothetical protein
MLSSATKSKVAIIIRKLRTTNHVKLSMSTVSSPHPDWKVGEKQCSPYVDEFVALDPRNLGSSYFLTIR